jgi:gliding motility-associated protein GldE
LGAFFTFLFIPSIPLLSATSVWGAAFLLLFLLICSASMSASEVAFFGLNRAEHDALETKESAAAQRVLQLLFAPKRLLATILLVNNFVNIGIVILLDFILKNLSPEDAFQYWGGALQTFTRLGSVESWQRAIGFGINTVGATALIVLFGEITPKLYAQFNRISFAEQISTPLKFLVTALRPVSGLLVRTSARVEQRLASYNVKTLSDQDLHQVIELTVSQEADAENEATILKRIVHFGDVSVKQIMTSRVKVSAVSLTAHFLDVLKTVREAEFSRLPVFQDDFDSIVGFLYSKDLIEFIDENNSFEWQSLVRTDVMYVPESRLISDVLRDFQRKKMHVAVVVDEYGSAVGIVTLEDIMEEVIGEIRDEFDSEPEIEYQKIDDHTFIFEGKSLINDICRVLKVETDTFEEIRGDADSIAGLLLELKGAFPKIDEELSFGAFKFKALELDKRRIQRVQLEILPNETELSE